MGCVYTYGKGGQEGIRGKDHAREMVDPLLGREGCASNDEIDGLITLVRKGEKGGEGMRRFGWRRWVARYSTENGTEVEAEADADAEAEVGTEAGIKGVDSFAATIGAATSARLKSPILRFQWRLVGSS